LPLLGIKLHEDTDPFTEYLYKGLHLYQMKHSIYYEEN
jgi:hypothetical protein